MTNRIATPFLACLALTVSVGGSLPVIAEEKEVMVIDNVRIRGDQELPLVLHIVPWQPPVQYSLDQKQHANAVLRPIEQLERESFQRLVTYHQLMLDSGKEQANVKADVAP
jgi:hypothetical protein